MREKPKDNERILHMLEAIENIIEFVNGKTFEVYKKDKILRFAIIKNLEIIGEAAYLLTKDFKNKHNSIEWGDIIGMRHTLFMVITRLRMKLSGQQLKLSLSH